MTTRCNPEDLMEFPCHYQFKAIGKAGDIFLHDVVNAVSAHATVAKDAVRSQPSRAGTYQSVSVLLTVYSADQLTDIYAELKKVSGLKMLL